MKKLPEVRVTLTGDDFDESYSCASIATEARARRLLAWAGGLYVVVGLISMPATCRAAKVVRVVPDELYQGERATYGERGRELHRLYAIDSEACEALRARFYDGMPVTWQGRAYRLTADEQLWFAFAKNVEDLQGELFGALA